MILTPAQIDEMRQAAQPLMSWLDANCHPHCTAIVEAARVELVEGIATAQTAEPLRG